MPIIGAEEDRSVGHDRVEVALRRNPAGESGVLPATAKDPGNLRMALGIVLDACQYLGDGGGASQIHPRQAERAAEEVEVAVVEAGDNQLTFQLNDSGRGSNPGLNLSCRARRDNSVPADRQRFLENGRCSTSPDPAIEQHKVSRRGGLGPALARDARSSSDHQQQRWNQPPSPGNPSLHSQFLLSSPRPCSVHRPAWSPASTQDRVSVGSMIGRMTAHRSAANAAWIRSNIASSRQVPMIDPPEPANLAEAPRERANSTIRMCLGLS